MRRGLIVTLVALFCTAMGAVLSFYAGVWYVETLTELQDLDQLGPPFFGGILGGVVGAGIGTALGSRPCDPPHRGRRGQATQGPGSSAPWWGGALRASRQPRHRQGLLLLWVIAAIEIVGLAALLGIL